MTVQNVEIKPDVSTEGVSRVSARKPVDMQRSAGRLLRAAAEKFYDAEIDIDWDSPWEEGKYFLPEHRVSLYGTKLWEKMSDEQKVELGRHEIVSILSFGIYAENLLSSALLRMSAKGALTDQRALYALNEIGDEARHSTMFARLINKTGLAPYKLPKGFLGFAKILHFVPLGPSVSGATLLIEEILDRAQREAMNDPKMQPQLRQLMKIHVLEEARHITFARLEMVEGCSVADASRALGIEARWRSLRTLRTRCSSIRRCTPLSESTVCAGCGRSRRARTIASICSSCPSL
ncbi:diiron oxygenase [Gordonia sp. Swx-4]|nr:diiron oxygenase [Gordonia sp. Swx-4]WJG12946.1 diiron oxygenase [Gordonia sp. Swx-4]